MDADRSTGDELVHAAAAGDAAVPAGILGAGWMTTDELAAQLGVDASTLRRWRTARPVQGPPFVRLSSRVTLYSVADVERWLSAIRVDPNRAA